MTQDFLFGETDTVQVMNSIEADNLIAAGATIYYRAGVEINLNINFEVESNAEFDAVIEACQQ